MCAEHEEHADSSVLASAMGVKLPKPIERNLFQAAGCLIAGATELPIAYLEGWTASTRSRFAIRDELRRQAAQRVAGIMADNSPEAIRAIDHFLADVIRQQSVRESILGKATEEVRNFQSEATTDQEAASISSDWLNNFSEFCKNAPDCP